MIANYQKKETYVDYQHTHPPTPSKRNDGMVLLYWVAFSLLSGNEISPIDLGRRSNCTVFVNEEFNENKTEKVIALFAFF